MNAAETEEFLEDLPVQQHRRNGRLICSERTPGTWLDFTLIWGTLESVQRTNIQ